MSRCLLPLALLLLLAACGTPQQRCLRAGTEDLRVVSRLIEATERDLARGYGIERDTRRVRVGLNLCSGLGGNVSFCVGGADEDRARPVAIDAAEERRKLADLRAKQAELRLAARPLVASCEARFPEG